MEDIFCDGRIGFEYTTSGQEHFLNQQRKIFRFKNIRIDVGPKISCFDFLSVA